MVAARSGWPASSKGHHIGVSGDDVVHRARRDHPDRRHAHDLARVTANLVRAVAVQSLQLQGATLGNAADHFRADIARRGLKKPDAALYRRWCHVYCTPSATRGLRPEGD